MMLADGSVSVSVLGKIDRESEMGPFRGASGRRAPVMYSRRHSC